MALGGETLSRSTCSLSRERWCSLGGLRSPGPLSGLLSARCAFISFAFHPPSPAPAPNLDPHFEWSTSLFLGYV